MIPRNERATRHEQHGMLPETTRMGIIQDKRNAKKHHEWDREKFHVLYACFLLAALGDDVYHVTHVVQFDDVVKFETKSPFLFHVTDDSHVGERVPAVHVVGRHALVELQIFLLEYVCKNFVQCFEYIFSFHVVSIVWLLSFCFVRHNNFSNLLPVYFVAGILWERIYMIDFSRYHIPWQKLPQMRKQ